MTTLRAFIQGGIVVLVAVAYAAIALWLVGVLSYLLQGGVVS